MRNLLKDEFDQKIFFSHLPPVLSASDGGSGGTNNMEGKNASHRIIDVPLGTRFRNPLKDIVIAELDKDGSLFLAARGGEGGKGNAFFKDAQRQTPLMAEKGGMGKFKKGYHKSHFYHFYVIL